MGIQGHMPLYYDQTAQRTKLQNQCNVPIRYAMYRTTAGQARDHARTGIMSRELRSSSKPCHSFSSSYYMDHVYSTSSISQCLA